MRIYGLTDSDPIFDVDQDDDRPWAKQIVSWAKLAQEEATFEFGVEFAEGQGEDGRIWYGIVLPADAPVPDAAVRAWEHIQEAGAENGWPVGNAGVFSAP
jgi:hypothetical protein